MYSSSTSKLTENWKAVSKLDDNQKERLVLATEGCSVGLWSMKSMAQLHNYYFAPRRGEQYCDEYVCLSVCTHNSKTTRLNFTKFFVHVASGRGSVLPWRRCDVMYFRFCGWRHIFIPWGQWARIKHNVIFRKSSPGGGTSWTSNNNSVWSSSSECGNGDKVCYLPLTCLDCSLVISQQWKGKRNAEWRLSIV